MSKLMVIWRHIKDDPQLKNSDQRWIDNTFIPVTSVVVAIVVIVLMVQLFIGLNSGSEWRKGAEKEINSNYVSRAIEWVNDGLFEGKHYSTTHEVKIKKGLPKWLKLWPLVILVMLGYFA